MKKAILIICTTFLFTGTLFSQMTLMSYDGPIVEDILDGDVLAFSEVGESVYFSIQNSSNEDINVKIKAELVQNSDGQNVQFCIGGNCLLEIIEGNYYPISGNPIIVPAQGDTMQDQDYFQNLNAGDGTNYPMDFVFKFFQVDENDNEIGQSITFTYRYDPNLSVSDFENNLGVVLQNTIVNNFLNVESRNPVNFEIFSINGQLINDGQVEPGLTKLNTSHLNAGIYFIRFSEGKNTATMKFVVK